MSYAINFANVFANKTLAKLNMHGVVIFLKKGYVSKNVTELIRTLNRARDLRFSLNVRLFFLLITSMLTFFKSFPKND